MSIDNITLVCNQEAKTMESPLAIRIGVCGVSTRYSVNLSKKELTLEELTLNALPDQNKLIKLEFHIRSIDPDPKKHADELKESRCHFFLQVIPMGDSKQTILSRIDLVAGEGDQEKVYLGGYRRHHDDYPESLTWNRKKGPIPTSRAISSIENLIKEMGWRRFADWISVMNPSN